ncbi:MULTISPECIES: mannitol dehydrogenase family protein [Terrabacteria group]|uniref:mannitol dehydrogenase family protein n=1 Tax=Bacillati TaxID=1783272 RepID=UPI001C6EB664|nr:MULTISPECIES: mannitol dehydrogenase family protein [Terrabacteria group]MBW9212101.1 mannitol dehydrogenase family protein [Trueperella sp. zg.1013]
MELNRQSLKEKSFWLDRGYELPQFNLEEVISETKENPEWIHFGAGNIFRAFQANLMQKLLNKGLVKTGLVAVDGFDYEIISKQYHPHDNLSVLVTLKADGKVEKTVIASIANTAILDFSNKVEIENLKRMFSKDSLKMASFTITEKGYSLVNGDGHYIPNVLADFKQHPFQARSYIGKVTALLFTRYQANQKPIAMVSMDNCAHNGDKLYKAVHTFAKEWVSNHIVEEGFLAYIEDNSKVSFPWTMIDKITPRPDASVEKILKEDGLNLAPVITSKGSYVAPFVNAEETEYLVIEDRFPNGKLPLEQVGVVYTNRETVEKVEQMKVCTCLNPLHTALAVYGCLLGFHKISDEVKDGDLLELIKRIGYVEGLPVVVHPGVLDPKEFIDTVIDIRLPNVFMPDTPQRIATDTSQKLAIRFGQTIKTYLSQGKDTSLLFGISLVIAGWLRYLLARDDEGNPMELSDDPLLKIMQEKLSVLNKDNVSSVLEPILKDQSLFGVDLVKAGLSNRIISYFIDMQEKGHVRSVLHKTMEELRNEINC